ncbi:prepilin-type N-terminal cleavage/methylation domain-containing protein [Clostridium aciditolerans]|uniref:Prepilin-type N-terminal cleavage/methylation domain-containing protein n=1 Tax=Clostridium aciditolerans TaxID=339861 RepID=A0A934M4Y3_9CLOT|nr:prepilin-type N-terminal cleavage/methylation domain-containing protein [Clostridium aciditolerans]
MRFIRENIKDRKAAKKGFTLIELMIVTALIGIIASIQVIIISKYMRIHRQEINESREYFYVNEAFMIIENQINNAKYAEISDNRITIKRYDGKGCDYIRKDRDSDIIISYGAVYSPTTNNIFKNAKEFIVEEKGRVLYITIETRKGKVYKRCLGLERGKAKKDLS